MNQTKNPLKSRNTKQNYQQTIYSNCCKPPNNWNPKMNKTNVTLVTKRNMFPIKMTSLEREAIKIRIGNMGIILIIILGEARSINPRTIDIYVYLLLKVLLLHVKDLSVKLFCFMLNMYHSFLFHLKDDVRCSNIIVKIIQFINQTEFT